MLKSNKDGEMLVSKTQRTFSWLDSSISPHFWGRMFCAISNKGKLRK